MVSVTEATAMGGCRKRTALCSILLHAAAFTKKQTITITTLLIIISPLALVLTTYINIIITTSNTEYE